MKQVDLTGSQREALSALARDQDRPWSIGSSFDPISHTIPAPIANLFAKRGLAIVSGGMGRRTVTITDVGMAEAEAGSEGVEASSLDVEAMAEALCESGLVTTAEARSLSLADLSSDQASHLRVRAQLLLKRYHELLRAKREGL